MALFTYRYMQVYETAKDRFPKATANEQLTGVANFLFVTYFCPAIIQAT